MARKYLERASYTWSEDSIRFINTPSQKARRIFLYVQEVGYFKTKPPYFTERENLESYLIIYTISGEGVLRYRGNNYKIGSGQAFWIYCGDNHYYATEENKEWEFLWVHFYGSSVKGYFDEYTSKDFRIISVEDRNYMERTMMRILSLTQRKEVHSELITSDLLMNIMTFLMIQTSTEGLALQTMPDYISTVLKYLENHFLEEFDLDILAEEAGISKYHLSRTFHKYMGMSLNDYVITKRINYAKELLRYTNDSVESIAYQSGIPNISYFIRQFRNKTDRTPLQYRKEWYDE